MYIAHIVPTSLLELLCSTSKVQMCLAHRVLSDEKYARFYAEASEAGQIVIMDNSLWELGKAMTPDKLFHACNTVKPTELIVPDVFRDGPATIESLNSFLTTALLAGFDGPMSDEFSWQRNMVVVHGKDRQEWLETYDALIMNENVHTFGLPKVLDEIWTPGGRIGCIEFLEASGRIDYNRNYHCLGIWEDPVEVMLLNKHAWIRSLDTALAVHAGMQGVRFDNVFGLSRRRPKRPHVYFDVPFDDLKPKLKDIKHNIGVLDYWLNGVGNARI